MTTPVMTTPAMPPPYKLKFTKKYATIDISDNVLLPNDLSVVNDSSFYGNLNVKETAVFHHTLHVDNTTAVNIITPQVNIDTNTINITTDVSVNTENVTMVVDKKLNVTSHDDISVVANKKTSIVGTEDVSINAPNLLVTGDVDITGELSIINGDIVLNGMSMGELATNTFRPIHYQSRLINPLCFSIYGGSIPAFPCPPSSFLQGWHYSDSTKVEYNLNNDTTSAKINWYFAPGTETSKMKNFKGLNIDTTLYNTNVPYVSIYTRPKPGSGEFHTETNVGTLWYQSRINFTYGDTSLLTGELATKALTSSGVRACLTHGEYSNVQLLGYTSLPLVYDKDYSVINTASKGYVNGHRPDEAEAFLDVQDQEILAYTIQTNSNGSNYNFVVHDYSFTETTSANDKTFIVSFNNILQSLMG